MFGLATKEALSELAAQVDVLMNNHFPTLNRRVDNLTHWIMTTLIALILAILAIVVASGAALYMALR